MAEQSFANIIIYGSDDDVAEYLRQEFPLDVIDEYGYTPLIQTAIVNSAEKAKLMLEAGADANFTDLTGRTALHWACENNNYEMVDMLIAFGANTNAYTMAGQPVLAVPFLRDYDSIKQLLYRNHADLNFTQDFINTKLIGHRYELEGRVDIVNNMGTFFEVEFEGFYLEFSLEIAANSLTDFKNNFGGKHLRNFFDKLQVILDCLYIAMELLKYQHYLVNVKQYEKRIDELLGNKLLIIPVTFTGHAITLIRHGNWLVRCDRGVFGREHGTVIVYRMANPSRFSRSFVKNLIYRRQDESFINESLAEILGLQKRLTLPLSEQTTGNCSWANVEAAVPATMFLLLLEEQRNEKTTDLTGSQSEAMRFFNDWVDWDKKRALDFCMQSFYSANPARRASKAAILAAVIFQKMRYDDEDDSERAEKILRILTTPDYHYIMQAYLDVFTTPKRHPLVHNLEQYLDDFGFDATRLLQQAKKES